MSLESVKQNTLALNARLLEQREALREENAKLRAALESYANPDNWEDSGYGMEYSPDATAYALARAALGWAAILPELDCDYCDHGITTHGSLGGCLIVGCRCVGFHNAAAEEAGCGS